jgi:choline dehydrogenase-like flavoprotein
VNPSLTIAANALRTAHRLVARSPQDSESRYDVALHD